MVMAGPIDAVRAIHNAFREDIKLMSVRDPLETAGAN
jgi:hypothetical protein